MSMSSGSRVRRDGTIAMSSKPYARRPFLPRPISTSMAATLGSATDGEGTLAAVPEPAGERNQRYLRELFRASGTGVEGVRAEPLDGHLGHQPVDVARVEHAGPEVLHRLGPAGHGEAQALLRVAAAVARRHEAREEGVAGPDGRARLHHPGVDLGREQRPLAAGAGAQQPQAAGRQGHDRVAAPTSTTSCMPAARSSASANSWPTSSSASGSFGVTIPGSARVPSRRASPSESSTVSTPSRFISAISRAYSSSGTPRGSDPENTHTAAPFARYSSLSTNSSSSASDTAGPRSLISV